METKRIQGPFPHLTVSENLKEAVKSAHPEEWKRFFKDLRYHQIGQLESCPDSDLTKERGRLTMITELEGIFLTIHQHATKTKPITDDVE